MIHDIQKKVKIKYLKASKKLDFSTNSIWSRSRLFVSYYAPHSVHCNVCNVTLFWHHLDILLSSSAHQIRHIYLVKCLIMFLLPKSIYYLVAPRLWSLMLFKKKWHSYNFKRLNSSFYLCKKYYSHTFTLLFTGTT